MKKEEEDEEEEENIYIYFCRNRTQTPQIIILSNTLFCQSSAKSVLELNTEKKSHQQDTKLEPSMKS